SGRLSGGVWAMRSKYGLCASEPAGHWARKRFSQARALYSRRMASTKTFPALTAYRASRPGKTEILVASPKDVPAKFGMPAAPLLAIARSPGKDCNTGRHVWLESKTRTPDFWN